MSNPVFWGAGSRIANASAATLTPAKPSGIPEGFMLAVVASENNAVHSTATAGWTKIGQQNSGAGYTASLFMAPSSAAAPVITWTGAAPCGAMILAFVGAQNPIDATLGAVSVSSGASNPHTSTSITSTRDGSLFIYIDACSLNTVLATPAGWTENIDTGNTQDTGQFTAGSRAAPTSGTASGAISVNGGNAPWVQWQVELRIAAVSDGLNVNALEATAWMEPDDGLSASSLEITAFMEPDDGLNVSSAEFFAWLEPGTYPALRRRQLILN